MVASAFYGGEPAERAPLNPPILGDFKRSYSPRIADAFSDGFPVRENAPSSGAVWAGSPPIQLRQDRGLGGLSEKY